MSVVLVKNVNDVTRLQALDDKKKVIKTEATIRDALRLDDAENIDCLPNEEIFTELSRMGYEKPSTKLTFSVICLSTCRKFNFSKYIFDSLMRNVDSSAKFYSVGKGFSGVDTPLFAGMIVAHQADEGAAEVNVDDVLAVGIADVNVDDVLVAVKIAQTHEIKKLKQRVKKLKRRNKLRVSKLRRLKKVGTLQRVDTSEDTIMDDVSKQGRIIANMDTDKDITMKDVADIAKEVAVDAEIEDSADVQGWLAESQAQIYQIDLEHANKVLSMHDDELEPVELQEVVEVVTTTKLMTEVVTAASATLTTADTLIIAAAPTLTTAPSAARRRKGVVIRDHEETATPSTIIHIKHKSKDKGKGIMVHEPKPLKKKTQIEQDEAYARELEAKLNKNIDWDEVIEMDYFKGMTYDHIRLIFEKKFNSNVAFLVKTKEQIEEEEQSRALKRKVESSEDKAAKKKKLDEEVEELRKHLQIVPNDDDVYTMATPLALKVPVVDYEIYTENNKPYYKIKRADRTHQLYLSFLSMLRNFDREDLEFLWKLVKERFASSKPKNFSDDFLLTMFEKPDVQAQI
uniref:Uncharacterized protein n=1 Tax=Tanacetum cinerariifolium TaxID=118510 RepID=A0A6L2LEC5_TANCI|nr:hypothetical protein [Tanacetum cinerariifolium]